MENDNKKSEQEINKTELRRKSNKKYYDRVKQENQEINKISNNNIVCQEPIKDIVPVQSEEQPIDIFSAIMEMTKTAITSIGQSMLQVTMTLAVPVILTWIFPRQPAMIQDIQKQLPSSSNQPLTAQEKQSQPQTISLNSLSIM